MRMKEDHMLNGQLKPALDRTDQHKRPNHLHPLSKQGLSKVLF
jgi:hypothetical protein